LGIHVWPSSNYPSKKEKNYFKVIIFLEKPLWKQCKKNARKENEKRKSIWQAKNKEHSGSATER
jgi:hypothetical protein